MRKGFTLIELMIVIAIIAIIAAIAIPNLLESRVTANEAAAATSLKSGVFPAQIQFQGGAYQDGDADNVGEYGHLVELGGNRATTGAAVNTLKFLQGPLAGPIGSLAITAAAPDMRTANGYNFAAYTPNATNAAIIPEETALAAPTTDQAAERNWAVAAAPAKRNDTGRRVFLISHEGQVRSPSAIAQTNLWYAATPVDTTNATSLAAGLADALTTDTDLGGGFVTTYPYYSK